MAATAVQENTAKMDNSDGDTWHDGFIMAAADDEQQVPMVTPIQYVRIALVLALKFSSRMRIFINFF